MISVTANIFVFAAYVFLLVIEFVFTRVLYRSFSTPWLITTLIYIMFIIYQILIKTNEQIEKGKVKEILYNIIDEINGVPLINKDNIIIIQWDVIFKKLIDKKEYFLYDNIVKLKTKTIDYYVNRYPSLLINSTIEMMERKNKIDTKSVIKGQHSDSKELSEELDLSEEIMNMLFIKYLSNNKLTLANIDSSIYFDILLNNEYEPPEYEKFGIKPDERYDGFSLVAYYKNKKYILVPRLIIYGKRIDKEKWLYRNIDRIIKSAENIASDMQDYAIIVDELSLKDLMTDYQDEDTEKIPPLYFDSIEDNLLAFTGMGRGKEVVRAYCSLDTNPSGYEIKLIRYVILSDGVREVVEEEKTVALGSAFQPLLVIMEKMPIISNNVRLALLKKDIENFVIK